MTSLLTNTDPAFRSFWHPVARSDQLSELPLHVQLLGTHYLLVRLGGAVRVFEDRCPHRSYPLSLGCVVDGRLVCPYHGYQFDAAGRCVDIPALPLGSAIPRRADLTLPSGVREHLGWVWISPEEPLSPLPDLPEIEDPNFGRLLLGPYTWKAGAAQMTDNFLDVSHFPFVHAGTFGMEEDSVVPPLELIRRGLQFSYRYHHEFRNGEDVSALQGLSSKSQHRTIDSSYYPPFGTVFRVHYAESDVHTVVVTYSAPVSEDTSRLFTLFASTDFDTSSEDQARRFEEKILAEDQSALEGYRSKAMDVEPSAEFHTRADRATVELRRVLMEIMERRDQR